MKIASSTLDFTSQHAAANSRSVHERLRARTGEARPDFEGTRRPASSTALSPAIRISDQARNAQAADSRPAEAQAQNQGQSQVRSLDNQRDALEHDPHLSLIRQMVEMLTGEKIQLISSAHLQTSTTVDIGISSSTANQTTQVPARAGFGVEYDRHEFYTESEQTTFQASGTIRTRDGKDISFQLDLQMSRNYREENHLSVRAGDAVRKDPLVINFDGAATQLQNQRFSFDLSGNGQQEQIALLGHHSGYLALDMNDNGRIDSGRELFGVASGNGFADLARYDDDGNGWIDENDAIYGKLRIWSPDGKNGGTLHSLKEKQVGALYLGSQATPFELRDAGNQSLGAVRSSGVWLNEAGQAGTLQQIDLSV
ncbi:MAG: hypothetical protein KBD39_02875 [Sterolibacterium sp.]|nr:hypothetical protein [Sterolibacterium sp.]MBP9799042.1 hypothetical protein [Sterolibacterium sp.]